MAGPVFFWLPRNWSPESAWHRVLGVWIGVWLGWFGLALVRVSLRLSRLTREIPGLDPFDAAPLRPIVRHGLSNGLAAAGLATFVGFLGLDMGLTLMLVVFETLALVLVGVAVALPLLEVRERVQTAKAAELAWCDRAIAEERVRIRSRSAPAGSAPLSDLLAYRALTERISPWPMDRPALRRALLYGLLPLLSWVTSALVQKLVERLVGAG